MAWRKQMKKLTAYVFFWLVTSAASADVVVVVSRDSAVEKLNRNQIAEIFLGKLNQLSDGTLVVPVDLAEDSSERKEFYMKLLGKSPAQMRAYWSKIIFTGRGLPPREIASGQMMKKKVAGNPSFVGYLSKEMRDSSVKTVMVVE